MHYTFPHIENLNDVYPYIKDNKAFITVDKGDYIVVNYVMSGKDTFPEIHDDNTELANKIFRECRGLIFYPDGKIMSRPFHKFFNVGERIDAIPDITKPHYILNKLDGSMIRPLYIKGGIRWGTKMGLTDVSMECEEFIEDHMKYLELAKFAQDDTYMNAFTPIFEYIGSREYRVVLKYDQIDLVLLACRDNITGEYWPYENLKFLSDHFQVPLVQKLNAKIGDLDGFVAMVKQQEDVEGVVACFDDGMRAKIKADKYCQLHSVKAAIEKEHNVCKLILEEKLDDLLPLTIDKDRERLLQYQTEINENLYEFCQKVFAQVESLRANKISRKDFALNSENVPTAHKNYIFYSWDFAVEYSSILEWAKHYIIKNCNSKTNFKTKAKQIIKTDWNEIDE